MRTCCSKSREEAPCPSNTGTFPAGGHPINPRTPIYANGTPARPRSPHAKNSKNRPEDSEPKTDGSATNVANSAFRPNSLPLEHRGELAIRDRAQDQTGFPPQQKGIGSRRKRDCRATPTYKKQVKPARARAVSQNKSRILSCANIQKQQGGISTRLQSRTRVSLFASAPNS